MHNKLRDLKENEFFRSVFTLISATSLAQLISILIYPILTKIYSPSEHGTFALYMSIITITGIVSTGKYEGAIMMPKNTGDAINLAGLSVMISMLVSMVLLILVIFFNPVFAAWLGDPGIGKWLYYIPLSTFLIGLFQTFTYLSNREKQFQRIALGNVSQSLVNSACKISTSRILSPGAGLIAGAIAGQLLGAVVYLWGFLRKEFQHLKLVKLSAMRKMAADYSLFPRYNMIHNLTNNFSGNLPVFVISYFYSSAEVGLYSLGFLMVFRPMSLITGAFTQVFSQKIITSYNQGRKIAGMISRICNSLFWFGLPFFLIAGFSGPWIFRIVFGDAWIISGKYMQVLLPWLYLVFISSPVSFLPDMLGQQRKAMWLDILKLLARVMALGVGVYLNKLYLALVLFSAFSTVFTLYSLIWYFRLAHKADHKETKEPAISAEAILIADEKMDL